MQPSSTIVERVAKAIYETAPRYKTWWPGTGEVIQWNEMVYDQPPLSKAPYLKLARAAIKAYAETAQRSGTE